MSVSSKSNTIVFLSNNGQDNMYIFGITFIFFVLMEIHLSLLNFLRINLFEVFAEGHYLKALEEVIAEKFAEIVGKIRLFEVLLETLHVVGGIYLLPRGNHGRDIGFRDLDVDCFRVSGE